MDDPAKPAAQGNRARAWPDSHAHLSYVAERLGQAVLDDIAAVYEGSGSFILDPGVEPGDYRRRRELLSAYGFALLATGIWPDPSAVVDLDAAMASLEEDIRDGACALGECGLDYHWMNGTPAEQESLFRAQAELALRYGKPLLVHSREAFADTLRVVREYATKLPVVIHCFGYGRAEAEEFLLAGCYLSFAGNISYKKADGLRDALAIVPHDRLLLETDAPYMNPLPRRGKDSSPLDIGRTYAFAARLRGEREDELAADVLGTMRMLFRPERAISEG